MADSKNDDWLVLVDRLDEPPLSLDDRAAAIAEVLCDGSPSKLFCQLLAGMIDPRGKNATMFAMRLMRKNGGRPKADKRIAYLMERLVDQEGLSPDAAVYEVQKAFGLRGHSRSKCFAALGEGRQSRAQEREFDEWKEQGSRKQSPE